MREVTVTFSAAEAWALWSAAGNSLDGYEDAMGVLLYPSRVRAGYRALEKLRAALPDRPTRRDR